MLRLQKLKRYLESENFSVESFLNNHVKLNINNQIHVKELTKNKEYVYQGVLYRLIELDKGRVFGPKDFISIQDLIKNINESIREDPRYSSWSKSLMGVKSFQSKQESNEDSIYAILKAEGEGLDINKLIDTSDMKELEEYKADQEVIANINNFSVVFINNYDVNKFKTLVDKNTFTNKGVKIGAEYKRPIVSFKTVMESIKAELREGTYYLKISSNSELIFKPVNEDSLEVTLSSNKSTLTGTSWEVDLSIECVKEFLNYIKEEEQNK